MNSTRYTHTVKSCLDDSLKIGAKPPEEFVGFEFIKPDCESGELAHTRSTAPLWLRSLSLQHRPGYIIFATLIRRFFDEWGCLSPPTNKQQNRPFVNQKMLRCAKTNLAQVRTTPAVIHFDSFGTNP